MRFCGKCGTQLNDDAKFCPKCGNPINNTDKKQNMIADNASWMLELVSCGESKLQIVKIVKGALGIELAEAKSLVDSVPCIIADGLSKENAMSLSQKLISFGCKTEIHVSDTPLGLEVDEESYNEDKESSSGGWMKTILYAFIILVVIGYFYDKYSGKSKEENLMQATEQVAPETEKAAAFEEVPIPKEELQPSLSPKEQSVADAGYNYGSMLGIAGATNEGFSNMMDAAEYIDDLDKEFNNKLVQTASLQYEIEYGAPTNPEEERLKEIYVEYLIKGFHEAMDGMDTLDKLGGQHR